MNELPPKQDAIVLIRKYYKADEEVRFAPNLWKQMQLQMDTLQIPLNEFMTTAVQLYLNDLLKSETDKKKWINFSEGQFYTSDPIKIPKRTDGYELNDEDIFEEV